MDDQTRQDLERLRNVVERAWDQVGHCLLVCMNDANKEAGVPFPEFPRRNHAAEKALGFPHCHRMFDWNDEPGRVKADVLKLIDNALGAS